MKNPFAFPYADWVPVPVRRMLFRFFPGRWTRAEVESIWKRAAERKKMMDDLTD